VHVKLDTGMGRLGTSDPAEARAVCDLANADERLELVGLMTHFATADELGDDHFPAQLERFHAFVAEVKRAYPHAIAHAANSAATLRDPRSHLDMVRCGIAVYGVAPSPALATVDAVAGLRPALSLRARVSYVKRVGAGQGVSYGLRRPLDRPTVVATVPVGYADGVPWRLGVTGGEVLIGGKRRPLAGSVTMDQILVDCGDDDGVLPGDEVVLLGRQGNEQITAWDWASLVGTIAYEILCGIGPRVPKVYT
jgi:alanine racemase